MRIQKGVVHWLVKKTVKRKRPSFAAMTDKTRNDKGRHRKDRMKDIKLTQCANTE